MAAPSLSKQLALIHTNKNYTGGGTDALDRHVMTTDDEGAIAFVVNSGNITAHQLEAGTDAESSPAVVRPDNHGAGVNAVVWKQKTFA
jgi:hypothetical protein